MQIVFILIYFHIKETCWCYFQTWWRTTMSEVHDLSLIIKKKLISTSHQHKNNLKPTLKDDSTVSVHELKSVSLSGSTTSPMMLRHRSADRASFSRRFGSRNSFGSVFQLLNSGGRGFSRGRGFHPGVTKTSSAQSLYWSVAVRQMCRIGPDPLGLLGQRRRSGPVQRGCPSSPALAARASFCWMWYSWNRIEIRWVIFRYFCRQDSEQLDSSGFTSRLVKSLTQSMKQFSVTLLYVPKNSLNCLIWSDSDTWTAIVHSEVSLMWTEGRRVRAELNTEPEPHFQTVLTILKRFNSR